jgi:hypothetical protein
MVYHKPGAKNQKKISNKVLPLSGIAGFALGIAEESPQERGLGT